MRLRARTTTALLLCGLLGHLISAASVRGGAPPDAFRSRLAAIDRTDSLTLAPSSRADQSRAGSPLRPLRAAAPSPGKSLALAPTASSIAIDRTAGAVAADRLARLASAFVRPGSIRGPPSQLPL